MNKKIINIFYLLKYAAKKSKLLFFTSSIKYIAHGLIPLVGIVSLGSIVESLVSDCAHKEVWRVVFFYLFANLSISLFTVAVKYLNNRTARKVSNSTQLDYMTDSVYINYHYAEDGSILDLKRKSIGANPVWFLNDLFTLFQYIVEFSGIAYLFITLSPWFILIIIFTCTVLVLSDLKKQKINFDFTNAKVPDNRKLDYLYRTMSDYKYAKEVRIGMAEKFLSFKYIKLLKKQMHALASLFFKKLCIDEFVNIVTVFQTVTMYIYFSYQVSIQKIDIAEYTVLLSATTLLASTIIGFFDAIGKINKTLSYTDLFREYKNKILTNSDIALGKYEKTLKIDWSSVEIVFSHVFFSYPGSDKIILNDINIKIKPGEKIGIVGLNGSGKTTLIKLLCRLYDPTKGYITVNGQDIKTIPYKEYTSHIGVLLQDFCLFAYSISENIAPYSKFDHEKMLKSIEMAGLANKIKGLNDGLDTVLYKSLDDNGIELSGGEGQKLALARAIYKDADMMILDEPTSTLDPIAEYEFFSGLSKISDKKTTFFISHRLSSTRFCDRILVLSQGHIAEVGNHDCLMKKGGIYADMFESQAKYYKIL